MNAPDTSQLVARLEGVDTNLDIKVRPVSFAPELRDIDVVWNDFSLTLSVVTDTGPLRLMLDAYVIDTIEPSDAIEFIRALVEGQARVRVSASRLGGRTVILDVPLGNAERVSVKRQFGTGLAEWEQRLERHS